MRSVNRSVKSRLAKLEQRTGVSGGLTDEDRAHMWAWRARVQHRNHGGPPPTPEQEALLARPGFWERLQRAWGRPAFVKLCIDAMERARVERLKLRQQESAP